MKVLSISLDGKIFELNSAVRQRQIEYGQLFDELHILVLSPGKEEKISANVWVYGAGGNKFFRLFRAWKSAKRIIVNKQINLVSAQDPFFTGLIGWLLKKKFRLLLQIQIHTDFLSPYFRAESLMNKIRVFLAKFLVWRADKIRVVSQRIKDSLMKMGVAEEGIIVVPIYSDIRCQKDKFIALPLNAAPPEAGWSFIFLTISRLAPVKNIGMQIEAMAEVVKKHSNAELWIIGDGQERKRLEVSVKRMKLNEPVKFLGWQNDLNEFYQQADAFLLTSNYEGWGLAVIEAAACGLPIIMTDVGCAGEIISAKGGSASGGKNNESGIVIPVGNRKKLEQAMRRLIEDSGLRKKLGENARQAILNLPNKEKTLQLYKKSFDLQ